MMLNIRAVLLGSLALLIIITPYSALADTSSTSLQLSTPATSSAPTVGTTTVITDPFNQTDVESAVRAYFADVPVMAAIAKCESGFTQFNADGSVLNGGSGGMLGVFQVNRSVHAKFALTLGDDINTLAGNLAYARYLYNQEGTDPWNSSKSCWGGVLTPTVAKADTKPGALSSNLKAGTISPQVATLQQLLNSSGYKVAVAGPGSPGNETTIFGSATKAAVQRFQCAQNIVCKGDESTTGFGYVGAKTRAALVLNS